MPETPDTADLARLRRTAREVFGWDALRPAQERAMRAVLAGRDALVVMPTGAGKSAIYQVPALLRGGATVVVSPLIALQRDQVAGLADSAAPAAVAVNSDQSEADNAAAVDALRQGEAGYLFLSPEQLTREDVVAAVGRARPTLVVVDEAHCVSTWGHGFRPAYRRIGEAVARWGGPPVLALTATASAPVREDIVAVLGLREPEQVVSGFDRPNLRIWVRRYQSDADKREGVHEWLAALPGAGIVYAATRRDTEQYAAELVARGRTAAAYHAGLPAADRRRVHHAFLDGEIEVVVATTAFGMGIDKPDVRFVVHAHVPDSPDSYYQEVGRAGRDGAPADVVLCYRPEDLGLRRFFAARGVDTDALRALTARLRGAGATTTRALREQLGVGPTKLSGLLNLLGQAGAVTRAARGRVAWADGAVTVDEAVGWAVEAHERRQRLDRSRVEMMQAYAETTSCRRRFLLGYLGEELPAPCGACDTCVSGLAAQAAQERDDVDHPYAAESRVRHAQWGAGTVMHAEEDRITVLFDEVGYKTLALDAVTDNALLRAAASG
ncbi:ATP-dependent DNA helicase RecQ [Pilimelia terevasa]|uniref:ATP-dependent DNA helicase RecQ n=1 Tax=Pilimelia terevasa TaxID=53372 RepID=A0A8J3FEW1_9ACTN|nr:ATP-dependent DNA helicase RecQ [Pilimelia terevasa]GGK18605.1 ATP-dependent DNA helicase RecQ [Pilimelia terevasa]